MSHDLQFRLSRIQIKSRDVPWRCQGKCLDAVFSSKSLVQTPGEHVKVSPWELGGGLELPRGESDQSYLLLQVKLETFSSKKEAKELLHLF